MLRRLAVAAVALVVTGALAGSAGAQTPVFTPGAPGIGDPYFPTDGNGGYDAKRYLLDVEYDPATDRLRGVTTMRARATQDLSSLNLDLVGLEVESVTVDRRPATWTREGQELVITPAEGLRERERFTVRVRYEGVPVTIGDNALGQSGFFHTDDGALAVGQPDAAATWYPVNDHPLDEATYRFSITVPAGLQAIANGRLAGRATRDGRTTWEWSAREPMASYLTTMAIGEFDVRAYREDGLRYLDAIDPDLLRPFAPRTGGRFAISGTADSTYRRLSRTIAVPAGGGRLSFALTRATESEWDFVFVEARRAGTDEWTTLRDVNGHTTQATGSSCPGWLELHPFLARYQSATAGGGCAPTGTTGEWWAASGTSAGYEEWAVDLSAYAGTEVEVSITSVTDDVFSLPGAFVDDVVVPGGGPGTTSFEEDGDVLDGWTASGPPEGSPPSAAGWTTGTAADAPPTLGALAEASLARQPEIIAFLSEQFGPYPFSQAGGIVDDLDLGFALETQTRPVYSKFFFASERSGAAVVVHELAHQWFGDDLALAGWQHIWLNEGFATYAEWLWSEREGRETAQQLFDALAARPADHPFWSLPIGDPGPELLFEAPVYDRGAMTLHALRVLVGDETFFRIVRGWARTRSGDNVTTDEFIAYAERVSGRSLDAFFTTWLFTPAKPAGIGPATPAGGRAAARAARALAVQARVKR